MSLIALAIDAMLPALISIGETLQVKSPNDAQLIVSIIFAGMGIGLVLYGPLSDAYGRKLSIYVGVSFFMIGSLLAYFSNTFGLMLFGRFLEGFGGASCRVVTMAMVRDKYAGKEMAKIVSFIMMVFIMVPAIAPSFGQLILQFGSWRDIFSVIIVIAAMLLVWFRFRQEETLSIDKRIPFSLRNIWQGTKESLSNPVSLGYTVAAGLIFGAFIGYLSCSQQLLQVQFGLGDSFPIAFGSLAISVGFSSFANTRLLRRYSMVHLCLFAVLVIFGLAAIFTVYRLTSQTMPSVSLFLLYLFVTFFFFGILFGNLAALALEPLGHIAGIANSAIGSLQTLMSVAIGIFVSRSYNGTIIPLLLGFLICSLLAFFLILFTYNNSKITMPPSAA